MRNLTSIHYLRAFSMLYIVAYWHLIDYAGMSLAHDNIVMIEITHFILGLFVFISGFLLGGRSSAHLNARQFYKRRLLRIYPLYALAVVVFYIGGINDGVTSVKALLGVSMLWQPAPLTLWFITMLVLFYLVTPLLLSAADNFWRFAGWVAGMMSFALLLQLTLESLDLRILLFFPCFCLGIYCARHGARNRLVNPWTAGLALLSGIALLSVNLPAETLEYLRDVPIAAGGAYLVFYLAWYHERRFKPYGLIVFFSYSSYAMYLFHRPVFNVVQAVYFPQQSDLQLLYLLTVGMIAATLVAWSLQKLYDYIHTAISTRIGETQKAAA